jgi:hypothetical protein
MVEVFGAHAKVLEDGAASFRSAVSRVMVALYRVEYGLDRDGQPLPAGSTVHA